MVRAKENFILLEWDCGQIIFLLCHVYYYHYYLVFKSQAVRVCYRFQSSEIYSDRSFLIILPLGFSKEYDTGWICLLVRLKSDEKRLQKYLFR